MPQQSEIVLKPRSPGWSTLGKELHENGFALTPNGVLISQNFIGKITAAAVESIADSFHEVQAGGPGSGRHKGENHFIFVQHPERGTHFQFVSDKNWNDDSNAAATKYRDHLPFMEKLGMPTSGTAYDRVTRGFGSAQPTEKKVYVTLAGGERHDDYAPEDVERGLQKQYPGYSVRHWNMPTIHSATEHNNFPDTGEYDEPRENHVRSELEKWVGYAESGPAYDPTGRYPCASCDMRKEPSSCTHVSGKISMEAGSCRIYIHGPELEGKPPLKQKLTQIQAQYGERPETKAFGCSRCEYGAEAKKADSAGRPSWCSYWGVHVQPKACCAMEEGPDSIDAPGENSVQAYGTSEGVTKSWDVRGRKDVNITSKMPEADLPKNGWKDLSAVVDGKKVGFIRIAPEGKAWSVRMVAVDPEHRREGIATELYRGAASYAQKHGASHLISDPGAGTKSEVAPIWRRMGAWENPNYHSKSDVQFRLKLNASKEDNGWHGVDLDGTIAEYHGFKGHDHIGEPIEGEALARVKAWLKKGETVKLFTARANEPEAIKPMEDFCMEVFGQKLEITDRKDHNMIDLLDDRAHRVEKNTGKILAYGTSEGVEKEWEIRHQLWLDKKDSDKTGELLARPKLGTRVRVSTNYKNFKGEKGQVVTHYTDNAVAVNLDSGKRVVFYPSELSPVKREMKSGGPGSGRHKQLGWFDHKRDYRPWINHISKGVIIGKRTDEHQDMLNRLKLNLVGRAFDKLERGKATIDHTDKRIKIGSYWAPYARKGIDEVIKAFRKKYPTYFIEAAAEQSFGGNHKGTLWNGIKLIGFTGPEEEALRAMLSRIPPELLTQVVCMESAKELAAKHGRFLPDEKKILFNPGNLTLRQRFGKGGGWIRHDELTVVHEVGHSLYKALSPAERQRWLSISGWMKGTKQGQAPAYVEKRPGWEPYTSTWTHKAGAKFPRWYAEKNPNEDFSDSFAFFMLNKAHQIGQEKRQFFEDYIQAHVKRYPQASIQSPVRAVGTSEGVRKAWDTRGRGRKAHEKAAERIHQMVTENPRSYTRRGIYSRLNRRFGSEAVQRALDNLEQGRYIHNERIPGPKGRRGHYVIAPRRPFPSSTPAPSTPPVDRFSPWQSPAPPVTTTPPAITEEPRPTQSIGRTDQGTGLPLTGLPENIGFASGSSYSNGYNLLRDGEWHSRAEFDGVIRDWGISRQEGIDQRLQRIGERAEQQGYRLDQRGERIRIVPSSAPRIETPAPTPTLAAPVHTPSRIDNPSPGQRQPAGFLRQDSTSLAKASPDVGNNYNSKIRMTDEDVSKFKEKFGMTPDNYRDILFKGVDKSTADGISMRINSSRGGQIWQVNATGSGLEINRTIDFEKNSVYHGYFSMSESMQGHGLAKTIFANSLDLYDHLGLGKIGVSAALSNGGYAWARFGFVPDRGSWQSVAETADSRARRDSSISPELKASVRLISKIEDPRAIWLLASLKDSQGNSIGGKLLRGQDWHGTLNLNDPEQYAIVRDYSGRTKK